ncbi:MAG TPA: sugar ABC transporter permease [Chloroflexota bacterium]|nr:sugar ABC transporter permease [Chloroflexota bacterium]
MATSAAVQPLPAATRLVARRPRMRVGETLIAYLWIAPATLIIGVFHFLPVLYAIYISTFRWGLVQGRFLGLGNYEQALADPELWNAFLVSLYYVVGTIPVALTSAFVVAYLLFQKINFRDLYRTLLFLPYVTSTVAAAMVFSWVFHPQYGVANYVLGLVGIAPQKWLLESTPALQLLLQALHADPGLPGWLYGPSLALVVVILFAIWHGFGFDVVIFLAGLSNIPREVEEAARIDGAGRWAVIRYVTLPLLSPTLLFLIVMATIRSFQAFNQIYVMTNGGPLNTTRNVVMLIFQNFYQRTERVGYAAAIAMILFGVILVITVLQLRIGDRRVHYG